MKRTLSLLLALSILITISLPAFAQTDPGGMPPGSQPPAGGGSGNGNPIAPLFLPLTDTGTLAPPAIDQSTVNGVPVWFINARWEQLADPPCLHTDAEAAALLQPHWPYSSQYPVQEFITVLCIRADTGETSWGVSSQPVMPNYTPRHTYPVITWSPQEKAEVQWAGLAGYFDECLTKVTDIISMQATLLPDRTDAGAWALTICVMAAGHMGRQTFHNYAGRMSAMYQEQARISAAEDAAAGRPPSRKTQVLTAWSTIWFNISCAFQPWWPSAF